MGMQLVDLALYKYIYIYIYITQAGKVENFTTTYKDNRHLTTAALRHMYMLVED
jgi:hypothetical protein